MLCVCVSRQMSLGVFYTLSLFVLLIMLTEAGTIGQCVPSSMTITQVVIVTICLVSLRQPAMGTHWVCVCSQLRVIATCVYLAKMRLRHLQSRGQRPNNVHPADIEEAFEAVRSLERHALLCLLRDRRGMTSLGVLGCGRHQQTGMVAFPCV
jgi:hypothetical protein